MATSKVLVKKRAAALKLKLKKSADAHDKARLDALQHAQEAEDLESAFEEEEAVDLAFGAPVASRYPEPVMDIPVAEPKRPWWKRLFD